MASLPNSAYKTRPSKWTVDLDAPGDQRWNEIIQAHREPILRVASSVLSQLESPSVPLYARVGFEGACKALGWAATLGLASYASELKGISRETGVPLGKCVALQLIYEVHTCCTSMVGFAPTLTSPDGARIEGQGTPVWLPFLARTLDWDMPGLEKLIVEVDFVRSKTGERVFSASTFAGFVGVFTGAKPDAFAISLNYRQTPQPGLSETDEESQSVGASSSETARPGVAQSSWLDYSGSATGGNKAKDKAPRTFLGNLKGLIALKWPAGYLLRHTLETASDHGEARDLLANCKLIAPCYYTLCGRSMGSVLQRGAEELEREVFILPPGQTHQASSDPATRGIFVQTNSDGYNPGSEPDILWSRARRRLASETLTGLYASDPTALQQNETLFRLMSQRPILNEETMHSTVMRPFAPPMLNETGHDVVKNPLTDSDSMSTLIDTRLL